MVGDTRARSVSWSSRIYLGRVGCTFVLHWALVPKPNSDAASQVPGDGCLLQPSGTGQGADGHLRTAEAIFVTGEALGQACAASTFARRGPAAAVQHAGTAATRTVVSMHCHQRLIQPALTVTVARHVAKAHLA